MISPAFRTILTRTRMSRKMNRLVLAGSVVLGTFVLGIFAVAIAQRDARNRSTAMQKVRPEYALRKPEPLTAAEATYGDQRVFSQSKPPLGDPLDVPPPLSARSVIRSNDSEVETEAGNNGLANLDPPGYEDEPEPLLAPTNQLLANHRCGHGQSAPTL